MDSAATVPVHGRLVWMELLRATQCPSNHFTSRDQGTIPLRMSTLGCSRAHSPPCSLQNPGRNMIPNSLLVPIPHRHGANWLLLSLEDFEISDRSGHMNVSVVHQQDGNKLFLCQLFFNFSHLFDAFRALFWFQLL